MNQADFKELMTENMVAAYKALRSLQKKMLSPKFQKIHPKPNTSPARRQASERGECEERMAEMVALVLSAWARMPELSDQDKIDVVKAFSYADEELPKRPRTRAVKSTIEPPGEPPRRWVANVAWLDAEAPAPDQLPRHLQAIDRAEEIMAEEDDVEQEE